MGVVLALLMSGAVGVEDAPEQVAVLDLFTPGLDDESGKALSANLVNIIATEVQKIGHPVISTADINAMLSLEKQKDLLGCESDTSCLAEIGGALGVDLMVSGTIGKLGTDYNLSLTLLDIKGAQVRQRFQGTAGSEQVLGTTAARGVAVLFGKEQDTSGTGTLYIKTNPPGGSVKVDGVDHGAEPVTVDDLSVGEHLVEATALGVSGKLTVAVVADSIGRHTVEMTTSAPVKLKVFSTPSEARVFLDGEDMGVTPLLLEDVRPGERNVRIESEGYHDWEEVVSLSHSEFEGGGRKPLKVEVELEERFRLQLPIEVGLSGGAVMDLRGAERGVGTFLEINVWPIGWFELGVGLTIPVAVPLTFRFWIYRGPVEIGAFVRATFAFRQPSGDLAFGSGAGASVALPFDTYFGEGGVRLDAAANLDVEAGYFSVPLNLMLFWRI